MRYDVAILGGGLAGLSLSIDLKRRGYTVIVIEKGEYPRHKVCGEYISMESHEYLFGLCPALTNYELPFICQFKLSSTGGLEFQTRLDLGGFGISRYLLEEQLFEEAGRQGVVFMLNSKAYETHYNVIEEDHTIISSKGEFKARVVCNATGRKSNFETSDKQTRIKGSNYIGVKYHVRLDRDPGFVEIHNFPGGYCGVSSIEDNKTCLCYIVNSKKLNSVGNSIPELEKVYLFKNKRLRKLFTQAEFLLKDPLTISGINFNIKRPATENFFNLGDAAGSIAPVTGNGMSIALRSASVLASLVDSYFSKQISRQQLVQNYTGFWNKEFSTRVKLSRHFQKLSESPFLANLSLGLFKPFPSLAKSMIRHTHGAPF
ncbi:MAG: FAD-binding protein [Chitinophagaceae bacterium]|nr:FAD-binding protein [Chitinophagaceae bacterium]